MAQYTVTAERGSSMWVLQCVEHPGALSEVTDLDEADVIKEAIAWITGTPEENVAYTLVVIGAQ